MEEVKGDENSLRYTYKLSGDEFTMSTPTGVSFTAKLDGKDYPAKGSFDYNSVSLKRIDERTMEETDKQDGKVTSVQTLTVAPDGKTLTMILANKLNGGRASTFVMEKQ